MQFTGRNLLRVHAGLVAMEEAIHTQIATCPDVIRYAEDIRLLEQNKEEFTRLKNRIEASEQFRHAKAIYNAE